MTILKVQYKDEIRRITLDNGSITLSNLVSKVHQMFPLVVDFTLQYRDDDNVLTDILTDAELNRGVTSANSKVPPIFRVSVVDRSTTIGEVEQPVESYAEEESQNSEVEQQLEEGSSSASTYCSKCGDSIADTAVSYKCINCFDVLLCEFCESTAGHDTNHLMVKLRVPVQNLTLRQQLIFTRYILDSEQKKLADEKKS